MSNIDETNECIKEIVKNINGIISSIEKDISKSKIGSNKYIICMMNSTYGSIIPLNDTPYKRVYIISPNLCDNCISFNIIVIYNDKKEKIFNKSIDSCISNYVKNKMHKSSPRLNTNCRTTNIKLENISSHLTEYVRGFCCGDDPSNYLVTDTGCIDKASFWDNFMFNTSIKLEDMSFFSLIEVMYNIAAIIIAIVALFK